MVGPTEMRTKIIFIYIPIEKEDAGSKYSSKSLRTAYENACLYFPSFSRDWQMNEVREENGRTGKETFPNSTNRFVGPMNLPFKRMIFLV